MLSGCGATQGVLHMSRRSSQEGSVQVGRQGTSLLSQVVIRGKPFLNRAMHGDVVAGMACTITHSVDSVNVFTVQICQGSQTCQAVENRQHDDRAPLAAALSEARVAHLPPEDNSIYLNTTLNVCSG